MSILLDGVIFKKCFIGVSDASFLLVHGGDLRVSVCLFTPPVQ